MEQPGPPGQKGGGDMLIDLHVADRQGHVPVPVGDEQIGGGGPAGHGEALADVDAQLAAGGGDTLGVHIVAEGGEHPHVQPHQSHVVGDVAPHAPRLMRTWPGLESAATSSPWGRPPMSRLTPPRLPHKERCGRCSPCRRYGPASSDWRCVPPPTSGRCPLCPPAPAGRSGVLLNPLENLPFPLSHGLSS